MKKSMEEFDELEGVVVHILVDGSDPPRALCSGEVVDRDRWRDTDEARKMCQACFLEAKRYMDR